MSVKPVRYIATIGIAYLALSGLLSVVFNAIHPKSVYQTTPKESACLKEVFPGNYSFESVVGKNKVAYYKVLDGEGEKARYAFKAFKKGYCSDIVVVAGIDAKGVITHVSVLEENETSGYSEILFKWKNSRRTEFLLSLEGRSISSLNSRLDAVAGATVSSRAVIDAIKDKGRKVLGAVSYEK